MSAPIIVAGLYNAANKNNPDPTDYILRKYDSAGNVYQHGAYSAFSGNTRYIFDVAVDAAGRVYCGGACDAYDPNLIDPLYGIESAATTLAFDPNGNLLWTANHGAPVCGICVDDSGNVYTVGFAVTDAYQLFPPPGFGGVGGPNADRTGYYNVRKYNSAGVLQWSADSGFLSRPDISFASTYIIPIFYYAGHVYIGGETNNTSPSAWGALTKIDVDDGSVVWRSILGSYSTGSRFVTKIIESGGNLFCSGSFVEGGYELIKQIDPSDGSEIASAAALVDYLGERQYAYDLAKTSSGDFYVLTSLYKANVNDWSRLHLYNSSLTYQESYYNVVSPVEAINLGVDADDGVYLSGLNNNSYNLYHYHDPASAYTWRLIVSNGSSAGQPIHSLVVREVETPPLALPVSLGVPTIIGDLSTTVPALALRLALGAPFPIRDYVGRPLPFIYRLYLDDLELPIANFSYRASATGNALNVTIPSVSPELVIAINALRGEPLRLLRGVRFANNTEQLDLLFSSTFSTMSYSAGAGSASIGLVGTREAATTQLKARTLTGVSYQRIENGRRTVRADIDTYLEVGDTALLGGGESLVVANLTVFVSPASGFMEISDA